MNASINAGRMATVRSAALNDSSPSFRKDDFGPRVRQLDHILCADGYSGQLPHQGNQSAIVAKHIPPRRFGVALHRHDVDQVLPCIEGQATVGVGGVDYRVNAGSRTTAGIAHAIQSRRCAGTPLYDSNAAVSQDIWPERSAVGRPIANIHVRTKQS